MDKDKLRESQPATDRQPDQSAELSDNWSPQPSLVYAELDNAAAEGDKRPGDTAYDRAMAGIAANSEHTGNVVEMQGHPFTAAAHEHDPSHEGGVKTDLEFDVPLRSGQGQSGVGEPPVILPTVGGTPPNEASVISLPVAQPRQGT